MTVSSPLVHIKNYLQRRIVAFYYDPLGPTEPPKWRRSDICPEDTSFYIRTRQGPLRPGKKKYGDLAIWVDPHLTIFQDLDPAAGGGSKKIRAGVSLPL